MTASAAHGGGPSIAAAIIAVRDFVEVAYRADRDVALATDVRQMTLFTRDGVINALVRREPSPTARHGRIATRASSSAARGGR